MKHLNRSLSVLTDRRIEYLLATFFVLLSLLVQPFSVGAQRVEKNLTERSPVKKDFRDSRTESPDLLASYTNSTPITITDCPNPCPASGQAASLYPSPITVSGEAGVVQRVSVTLNGFSHGFPSDTDFLLVSPSGRKSVLMSDFGAGSPGASNINVTLDDYAATPVPSTVTGNTGFPFVTGTYRPANSGTTDLFPAPAPAAPYTYTLSAFNGENPNGTWSLYIIDDANLDSGSISGGWTISFSTRPAAPATGNILISEFRTRGVGTAPPSSDGSADEFIELYNNTDQSITIIDAVPGADPTGVAGAGWRLSVAQGASESNFQLLSQTSSTTGPLAIPPRGYFLFTTQPTTPSPTGNTYSLAAYPTGTGLTASGATNFAINPASATVGFLPDDAGLAIFSTATALAANRLDSVGFSSVTNALYKEGAGLAPSGGITTSSQHSWTRRGRLTAPIGAPLDTGDNAADFALVETTGALISGVQAVLGAPGPQRGPTATAFTTSAAPGFSPLANNVTIAPVDPLQPENAAPNRVYDPTPVTNGSLGTLKIRRTITNNSGRPLLALRYRVFFLSTLGTSPALADLRVLNSPASSITLTDSSNVNLQALTLQQPPAQALGGGVNSSLSEGVITTTAPLANGASTNVELTLGVNSTGAFRFGYIVEASTVAVSGVSGSEIIAGASILAPTAAHVTIEGRVVSTSGQGVSRAVVTMTDSSGQLRFARTNSFGYYSFSDVAAGNTYTFTAEAKGFQTGTIVYNVSDNASNVDIALEE